MCNFELSRESAYNMVLEKIGVNNLLKHILVVEAATGFIVACALMHPEKKLSAINSKGMLTLADQLGL